MIVATIYSLWAMTALWWTYLLLNAYAKSGYRLLLWSGLCFAGLTINNLLLVIDKLVIPDGDLSLWRTASALGAMMILLYGLVWDSE